MVTLLLGLAACAGAKDTSGTGLAGSLQVKGSDTMVNLGSAWAEEFMAQNAKVSIAVTGGGSGTGIAALINKSTDICQASRAIKPEEIDKARSNGVDPKEFVVALDGLAVVVNPANPVSELTFAQLADIYTGKISNWKDVGGKDEVMVVLSRDTNSGTHVFFKEHVLQSKDPRAEYGGKVQMMAASQAGVIEVRQNPKAIFYVGLGYVGDEMKALAIKREASSEAVKPSQETVKSGEYAIARPLYLYTNGEPTGLAKAYIDWIMGADGQRIVRELDFVPAQ
jgi:phosphate transport system substrate-binding protein